MTRTTDLKADADFCRAKEKIELISDDHTQLVALSFGMSIFSNTSLSTQGKELLTIYDRFLELCPSELLTHYSTENMTRHKKITKTTVSMLPTWLKPDAPIRDFICIELKSGNSFDDAPRNNFYVFGVESKYKNFTGEDANVISMSFDSSQFRQAPSRYLELFVDACSLIKFRSGLAGFHVNCSRYESEEAETQAWRAGMRFRALDIPRVTDDAIAVGTDGIKGIGWLTALDADIVESVGGVLRLKKMLGSEVEIIEVPNGIILKIGAEPTLGDRNRSDLLPTYKLIYNLLSPFISRAASRSPSFDIADDYVARTEQWFNRLSNA
jgi:hypothetical protein